MANVRIYKPARNAMQSGRANTKEWVLEFERQTPRTRDPLMGWTSSTDTRRQLKLEFDTLDDAVAYAQRAGLAYQVEQPAPSLLKPKSYADNFRYDRLKSWTH